MWQPIYEELFRTQEWGKYPSESVVRFVARNFYRNQDRSQVRLLDLGCGPGANTWFMAREGFNVSAIDGSPTAIERCRERLKVEVLTADLRVGDFMQLPWSEAYFDGVIDNEALTLNPPDDWRKTVAEIQRVLKPTGRLLSICFTKETSQIENRGEIYCVDRAQIAELYRGFQCEIEEISRTDRGLLLKEWVISANICGLGATVEGT